MNFDLLEFEDIAETIIESFKDEFGSRKYNRIEDKVLNSAKIERLVNYSVHNQTIPPAKTIIECLMSTPFFFFAKRSTLTIGATIFLLVLDANLDMLSEFVSKVKNMQLKETILQICNETDRL